LAEETVGGLAELYLGNILYAIELAALSLAEQGKPEDAAYYRGIGRALAEAHGRAKSDAVGESPPRAL
jgi:hypothetical protein